MKAQLTDGSIVELVKDCECITHDGPHWLHADALMKKASAESAVTVEWLAANARSYVTALSAISAATKHAEEEMKRLEELHREMARRGIVQILEDA